MDNPEAVLYTPRNEQFFYTAVEEAQRDLPQTLWEALLSKEFAISPDTVAQGQVEDVTESPEIDEGDCLEDVCIGDRAKAAVQELVAEELITLIEE